MTDIDKLASDILDVGDRFLRTDDYEARMDRFAQEIEGLDSSARNQLFDEILEQDSGALMSWLTVDRLNGMVVEGRISDQERGAIFDAFGDAYVDGDISFQDAMQFTNVFGTQAIGPLGLSPDAGALDSLVGTLTGSNSPYSSEFIEKFASELLTERVLADAPALLPGEQGPYAGVLLNALDQAGGSSAVNAVLSTLSDDQKTALRDALSADGRSFENPMLEGANVRDPMAIYIEAVSRHGSSAEAVDLVRYVNGKSSGNIIENQYYDGDNKPLDARAEALGELFVTHGDAILTDLTVANPTQTGGSTNDRQTVIGDNLAALSNLVRITGLNPDNSRSEQVMDLLGEFTSENIRIGNMQENSDVNNDGVVDGADIEAIDAGNGRTAMIGAVMQDAVSSGYVDLRADIEARDAFMGFILDTAISAIPVGGDLAADAISDHLKGALGGLSEGVRDQIAESLSAIPKELLTNAQGQLTDQAKEAIIEALPEDYQYLEGIKNESNTFIQDIILGASHRDYQITESIGEYGTYIDGSRGS